MRVRGLSPFPVPPSSLRPARRRLARCAPCRGPRGSSRSSSGASRRPPSSTDTSCRSPRRAGCPRGHGRGHDLSTWARRGCAWSPRHGPPASVRVPSATLAISEARAIREEASTPRRPEGTQTPPLGISSGAQPCPRTRRALAWSGAAPYLGAARTTRGEQGELPLPIGEDLVPSLPDLSQFVLEKERLRRIRIFLRLRIGPFVEPGDVGGEFVVEVGFEAHEGLLPALFPVDFGDAFKIDVLLARHTARIRRPIYDGVATQPLSPLPGSGLTAMAPRDSCGGIPSRFGDRSWIGKNCIATSRRSSRTSRIRTVSRRSSSKANTIDGRCEPSASRETSA